MNHDTIAPLGYVFMPHHISLWRAKGIEANYQGQLKMNKQFSATDSYHKNKHFSDVKK
ncbi:hypothetical protein [Piscirickettsia litoralis]|uniref:hypothetical protein n=1 Tax=Piscirickettsia litoralis TaxID=1891921 RepID=UPI0013016E67|nr:hypothetical protein [Piscirickettsia litoralis]